MKSGLSLNTEKNLNDKKEIFFEQWEHFSEKGVKIKAVQFS